MALVFEAPGVKRHFTILAGVAMGLLGLGVSGCSKQSSNTNSTSVTGGQTTQIHAPTGTATGLVEDDNGNPVPGASVYVAGLAPVTTNAGGEFTINAVVVGATAANGSAVGTNGPINVQIVPAAPSTVAGGSETLLSASVVVTPAAQFSSSSSTSAQTNPQVVFVDGFTASTGVVRIPALSTTVTGTILNTATGNPVPVGTHVDLDFIGANFDQVATGTGVAVTYGEWDADDGDDRRQRQLHLYRHGGRLLLPD